MTIAVLVTMSLFLALIVVAVVRAEAWRRRPRELRGNWWARFERDFRAYASAAQPRHHRR